MKYNSREHLRLKEETKLFTGKKNSNKQNKFRHTKMHVYMTDEETQIELPLCKRTSKINELNAETVEPKNTTEGGKH